MKNELFNYAELDDDNVCKAILQSGTKSDNPIFVPIPFYDSSYLGKKYEDGEWMEVLVEPTLEPYQPTNAEVV